eukprot:scaffold55073_cov67-Phaeocystis_antarctica.AAC.4
MRNRTLTFVGESSIRDLGFAVASFLSGVTPERAEDFKFQAVGDTGNMSLEHESRAWEALGRPDGLSAHCGLLPCPNGSETDRCVGPQVDTPARAAGGCVYSITGPTWRGQPSHTSSGTSDQPALRTRSSYGL